MSTFGSHEYQVHHHVNELMKILGISREATPGAEVYTEMLLKNISPYISTQIASHNAKRKIAESSPTPAEFLEKYDTLKGRNVRDVDAVVYLLSKLIEDEQTLTQLRINMERRAGESHSFSRSTASSSIAPRGQSMKMSGDELEKLKAQLSKVTMEPVQSSVMERQRLRDQHLSRNMDFPELPDWVFQRSFLTMDFAANSLPQNPLPLSLHTLPLQAQELLIVEDLLSCLMGIDGKYIHSLPLVKPHSPREFHIDTELDPSIHEMAKRILPLCSHYSTVARFIEEKSCFEYGQVLQALAAAMRSLIQSYLVIIAQLEGQFRQDNLLLQKLWYVLQAPYKSMALMASIATSINRSDAYGGAVLTILHERTMEMTGDSKKQDLCLHLTQAACVPYFNMLERWIYKGLIVDPYSEFMVEENKDFQREKLVEDYNDAYWEQHCVLVPVRIPVFLENAAEKILNTGKYLNVVRLCGRYDKVGPAEELIYGTKQQHLLKPVDEAYKNASKLLLSMLMDEKDLMQRFKSVKHYFLLDQGDFIVQFLDMAEEEMRLPMEEIADGRLESLLELALRCSTTNEDPYKDDLRVELLPFDLITQLFKVISIETKQEKDYRMDNTDMHLSGLEAFSFDYVVKWPLSLVLNRKVLTRYQMLFRHFFYCKHVERQICNVWRTNKKFKQFALHSSRWHAASFALRQRMLNFVQNLQYYMMFEVIEPKWHTFFEKLKEVENIDDVLKYQIGFLDSCLNDCMLTNPDLLRTLHKLMMICVTFSNFIQRLSQSSSVEHEVERLASSTLQVSAKQAKEEEKAVVTKVVSEHVDQLTSSEDFEKSIAKFDANFTKFLVSLLEQIQKASSSSASEHQLIHIVHRLDFSGFYLDKKTGNSSMRVD